jgi:hypothetical protein
MLISSDPKKAGRWKRDDDGTVFPVDNPDLCWYYQMQEGGSSDLTLRSRSDKDAVTGLGFLFLSCDPSNDPNPDPNKSPITGVTNLPKNYCSGSQ